jgi:hypothetical protein
MKSQSGRQFKRKRGSTAPPPHPSFIITAGTNSGSQLEQRRDSTVPPPRSSFIITTWTNLLLQNNRAIESRWSGGQLEQQRDSTVPPPAASPAAANVRVLRITNILLAHISFITRLSDSPLHVTVLAQDVALRYLISGLCASLLHFHLV